MSEAVDVAIKSCQLSVQWMVVSGRCWIIGLIVLLISRPISMMKAPEAWLNGPKAYRSEWGRKYLNHSILFQLSVFSFWVGVCYKKSTRRCSRMVFKCLFKVLLPHCSMPTSLLNRSRVSTKRKARSLPTVRKKATCSRRTPRMLLLPRPTHTWCALCNNQISGQRNSLKLFEIRRCDEPVYMSNMYPKEILLRDCPNSSHRVCAHTGVPKNATVCNLACHATLLMKLQNGSKNTNAPRRNEKIVI